VPHGDALADGAFGPGGLGLQPECGRYGRGDAAAGDHGGRPLGQARDHLRQAPRHVDAGYGRIGRSARRRQHSKRPRAPQARKPGSQPGGLGLRVGKQPADVGLDDAAGMASGDLGQLVGAGLHVRANHD